ncbi:coiled-coil domain-containing protein 180 [Aplochiton taeniatus]
MAETRVIPSGKVYRQMFDAQVQLSRSLHESRQKRAASDGLMSGFSPPHRAPDTGQKTGAEVGIAAVVDSAARSSQKSIEDQQVEEDVRGLPDVVVTDRSCSGIVERLMEKKHKDHLETLERLHKDLAVLSLEYEGVYQRTGEELLQGLSELDDNVEREMQRMDNLEDLETFTLQELNELWDRVSEESRMRRRKIRELDETLTRCEADRTTVVAALLRKYTSLLEKISFVLPSDVHRLMDGEAMMINQALLANRRSLARLLLNQAEDDLQKDTLHRLRWEDKLQDWRGARVQRVLHAFKELTSSPAVQSPHRVQQALEELKASQQELADQRNSILQEVSRMVPPHCSKAAVSDWYDNLSVINKKIDSLHVEGIRRLHCHYESTWQHCLAQVDRHKEEIAELDVSPEEIQDIINTEFLPLLGQSQTQAEERLAALDRAYEGLAQRAAALSRCVAKVLHGATGMWERHCVGLQRREQQLQDQVDEVRTSQEVDLQRKEAHLDVLLDRLRQESTEETLKITLDRALNYLDEIKNVYVQYNSEQALSLDCYPGTLLEELQSYSLTVSHFFHVKEVYSQSSEELSNRYSPLLLGKSFTSLLYISEEMELEMCDSECHEEFTSTRGGRYSGLAFQCSPDPVTVGLETETQPVLFPAAMLTELLTRLRLFFFDHLENHFQDVLTSTVAVVAARKEALHSEHNLRLHLHTPRGARIKMDVHNTRAAELVLHKERVDRHIKGILQVLSGCKTDFQDLQGHQIKLMEDFRTEVNGKEEVFIYATKSDVLVNLSQTLQASLKQHIKVLQASQRHFRKTLENTLDSLRNSNAQMLSSFKLFSEGGNFTPKEIDFLHRRLEKMGKRIDAVDEAIQLEMEGAESKSLEQAKEVVSRFEERFHFLTADLKFLERIQSTLTSTQVQIKAEAIKSNAQKKHISNMLQELESMIDSCASHSPDRTMSPEDILSLIPTFMELLKTRCQYLACFLDPSMAAPLPDCPLQGSFALAARPRSRRQDKGGSASDSLLQPSKMGVAFLEDAAVGVVRGLLRLSRPAPQEGNAEAAEKDISSATGQRPAKSHSQSTLDGKRRSAECLSSVKRFSKPTRFDKRFQVFGSRPEESSLTTFKCIVCSHLWKANDMLLIIAEDFYKKKERRSITRPQYLQETFEQGAEDLNKRLLAYQSQTNDYLNQCLLEFRQQLYASEEGLGRLPAVVLSYHGQQHLERLVRDCSEIRLQLQHVLTDSEDKKREHKGQLSVRLSHPACEVELQSLRLAEEDRQKQLNSAIHRTHAALQECVHGRGEEFVTSLATQTENLLFQLDNLLTVDQVMTGQCEVKKDSITTLIRSRQAAALQEDKQPPPQASVDNIQRGSRTWPGLTFLPSPVGEQELLVSVPTTASITTAKTSLGHLKAVEERDTVYQRYVQCHKEELLLAEQEEDNQLAEARRWEEHWKEQLDTLDRIDAE